MKGSFVKYLFLVLPYPPGSDLNLVPEPVACGDFTSACEFVSARSREQTFYRVSRSGISYPLNFMVLTTGCDCVDAACDLVDLMMKEVI